MKLSLFLCGIIFYLSGLAISDSPWPPKYQTFKQIVDHFNFENNDMFVQRILYFDDYYQSLDSPVLFYCGNEGDIEGFWNNTGFAFELAKQLNALVVFAEHRYYGDSLPFGNKSFQQPYLKYLSIEQALADYAYIIYNAKQMFNITGPFVTLGGSYGGMLAAYMRLKYPNLVLGAIASSAPIYWIANEGNRHEFFEVVTKDLYDVNPRCVEVVKTAYDLIAKLADQGDTGLNILSKEFKTCDPLKDLTDVNLLKWWIRGAFVSIAMVDYPYAASFMGNLPAWPVNASCSLMLPFSANDSLAAVREAVGLVYNTTEGQTCYNLTAEYIECADPTGCGLGNDATAWDFQACTEMNLYDDTMPDRTKDMFPYMPFSKEMRIEYCMKKYNVIPVEEQLEVLLWGGNILSSSNIVFPNGDLDPWHLGGVLTNLTQSLTAFLIEGGAHHLDLRESNDKDPESVRQCRKFVASQVSSWLQQHYNKKN